MHGPWHAQCMIIKPAHVVQSFFYFTVSYSNSFLKPHSLVAVQIHFRFSTKLIIIPAVLILAPQSNHNSYLFNITGCCQYWRSRRREFHPPLSTSPPRVVVLYSHCLHSSDTGKSNFGKDAVIKRIFPQLRIIINLQRLHYMT